MKKAVFVVLVLVMMLAMALPVLAYEGCPPGFVEEITTLLNRVDRNNDGIVCTRYLELPDGEVIGLGSIDNR